MDVSCHMPFLPGTSVEPAVIPTAQASSFTLQYLTYCVMFQVFKNCSKNVPSLLLLFNPCLLTCWANSHMTNYKNSTAQTHNDKQFTNVTGARKTNRILHSYDT